MTEEDYLSDLVRNREETKRLNENPDPVRAGYGHALKLRVMAFILSLSYIVTGAFFTKFNVDVTGTLTLADGLMFFGWCIMALFTWWLLSAVAYLIETVDNKGERE